MFMLLRKYTYSAAQKKKTYHWLRKQYKNHTQSSFIHGAFLKGQMLFKAL